MKLSIRGLRLIMKQCESEIETLNKQHRLAEKSGGSNITLRRYENAIDAKRHELSCIKEELKDIMNELVEPFKNKPRRIIRANRYYHY